MKTLMILCFSFAVIPVMAQHKYELPRGGIPNVPLYKTDRFQQLPQGFYRRPLGDTTRSMLYLNKGISPGVYFLPQDNMPCKVPNTQGIVSIPNASPVIQVPFRTTMPNAIPYKSPGIKK